jgi:hypothetical protein
MLHLEEETHILKTSCFATFVQLFPNLGLQIKVNKTFKNAFGVLFLGW